MSLFKSWYFPVIVSLAVSFVAEAQTPAAPVLSAPSSGAVGQATALTLQWGTVATATSYTVQVATSSTFAALAVNQAGITNASYALSGLVSGATYYWMVNATNGDSTSPWSSVWSFTTLALPAVPALAAPANLAANQATSLTLSWTAAARATTYEAQVSTISTFATTFLDQSGLTGTSAAVSGLSAATIYYWRVNAGNANGTSAWSTVRNFATSMAAPTLASPANGDTGQAMTLTLQWGTVPLATSYTLQVSATSTFTVLTANQSGLSAGSSSVSGLASGATYYWRVNATNGPVTSLWSTIWNFTTSGVPLTSPVLSAPATGTTGQPTSLTLQWGAVHTATAYAVEVSTSANFAVLALSQSGITDVSFALSGLTSGTTYYWMVNATNSTSTSEWSGAWNFTTLAVPAAPALAAPANLAINQATTLTLSWTAAARATSYEAQVSTVSTFASTVFDQAGLTGSPAVVSGLLNGTTYYWRVDAANSVGTSPWSTVRRFTTVVASPGIPVLSSPGNGTGSQPTSLTMSWGAVTGAASYSIQVATVSTFASTVSSQTGVTAVSASVSGLANTATYYWEVNATNPGGTSDWSSVWSFTTAALAAPVLSSPGNGTGSQPTSLTMGWGAVTGAASYTLQVATTSTFATTVLNQASLTAVFASDSGLANNTTYYWEVNASNSGGTSAWSTIWSFTTIATVLPAPVLVLPANGAADQPTSLTLQWGAVATATSYTVQVATSSTFAAFTVNQAGISGVLYALSGLTSGVTYYWKVEGTNGASTSTWSSVWSFTSMVIPTTVAVLSSPANGSINLPTTLTMMWNAATGDLSYTLQVSVVTNFATTFTSQSGLTGTSGIVTGLNNNAVYYWRANVTNSGGIGAWSSVWSFMTVPSVPAVPIPTSPANGAGFALNATVNLAWGSVTGATSYTTQVSTVSTFAAIVFNQSGTSSSVAFVNSSGAIHYWRVSAANAGGTSAWSTVESFITTVPVLPTSGTAVQPAISFGHGVLSYRLNASSPVEIAIFDILGKKALSLGYLQAAGSYRLPLNTTALSSGRYLLRFNAGGVSRNLSVTITR